MSITAQIARQLREVHFGENWSASNLKEILDNVNWQQANTRIYSFNTITALVYHMNYYVVAVSGVLEGQPLRASDQYAFDHPAVTGPEDWNALRDKTWKDAEHLASLIEKLPENILGENFSDPKYGNYFRNIYGVIEHIYYHMGQIVLIKKLVMEGGKK
jgi:hypothetical protein